MHKYVCLRLRLYFDCKTFEILFAIRDKVFFITVCGKLEDITLFHLGNNNLPLFNLAGWVLHSLNDKSLADLFQILRQ